MTKGENRLVIPLPQLGIVIKLPIIYLNSAFHTIKFRLSGKGVPLRDELFSYTYEMHGSLKRLLFKGILDNIKERRFYRDNKHPFCKPTCFSLFGLLNIQRYGAPSKFSAVDLWCQLYDLTGRAVIDDGHHFADPLNFSFEDDQLMILDYGSPITQEIIKRFGEHIMQNFNPKYSWEEEKKLLASKRKEWLQK